jgi:hypothetical protein
MNNDVATSVPVLLYHNHYWVGLIVQSERLICGIRVCFVDAFLSHSYSVQWYSISIKKRYRAKKFEMLC